MSLAHQPSINHRELPDVSRRNLRIAWVHYVRPCPMEGMLAACAVQCKPAVTDALAELVQPRTELAHDPPRAEEPVEVQESVGVRLFSFRSARGPPIHSVHPVKRRSIESVLTHCGTGAQGREPARLPTALAADEHVDLADREELRIDFVSVSATSGTTRSRPPTRSPRTSWRAIEQWGRGREAERGAAG